MGVGFRIFLVGEDDSINRLSVKSFSDFYLRQKPTLPKFSNSTITVAVAICALDGRVPTEIIKLDCMRVKVGADGAQDEESYKAETRLMAWQLSAPSHNSDSAKLSDSSVVNAEDRFDARRWAQLHPKLSGPALKRILQALFGRSY
ncbi:hypothetical protein [Massilia sp. S19_KUP03_FR1]|uniref:hypothetical protein n=1 Tax=Massilia sp. S19_KUP03_FR1 TaxID=3025503 RepID=UPI002FCCF221